MLENSESHSARPDNTPATPNSTQAIAATDWMRIARRFRDENRPIQFWRETAYTWKENLWAPISESDLHSLMYRWLDCQKTVVMDDEGKALRRFKPGKRKVAEVLDAFAAMNQLLSSREPPFWIEPRKGDPAPRDLLPFHNGVLNLRTGEFDAPAPRLFHLHKVGCDYDPEADAPAWDKFLLSLFPDDPASRETVEEMLGYSMTVDRSQQKVLMLLGPPRSGKGTIGRVLARLVGQDRYAGPNAASFSERFGLQQLIDKTVATVADARGGRGYDPYLVVERLLSISGRDPQSIDRKYLAHWTGILPTQIWWMSNELPKFADASGAIATRLILIELTASFLGREDTGLDAKLRAELPGIANRALQGYKRLCARGRFRQPEAGEQALRDIGTAAHPVRAWLDEECEIGPDEKTPTDGAYFAYTEWCEHNGFQKPNSTTFGKDLRAANPIIQKRRLGPKGDRKYYYDGLRVKLPKQMRA